MKSTWHCTVHTVELVALTTIGIWKWNPAQPKHKTSENLTFFFYRTFLRALTEMWVSLQLGLTHRMRAYHAFETQEESHPPNSIPLSPQQGCCLPHIVPSRLPWASRAFSGNQIWSWKVNLKPNLPFQDFLLGFKVRVNLTPWFTIERRKTNSAGFWGTS